MKGLLQRIRILCLTVCCSLIMTVGAREPAGVEFSYNPEGRAVLGYGLSRGDVYDIAMRISDADLEGGELKSMSVAIPVKDGCRMKPEVGVWIATELPTETPDASNTLEYAEVVSDGSTIECNFTKGISLPKEGLYVGYTLEVESVPDGWRQYPISVVEGNAEGSLYYRTRTSGRWDSTFSRLEYMSAMRVKVEKELPEACVSLQLPAASARVKSGAENILDLKFKNIGRSEIKEIEYRLSGEGVSETGTLHISDSRSGVFGYQIPARLAFTAPAELGDTALQFEILNINGVEVDADVCHSWRLPISVLPVLPQFRPLAEEYTGLWCGNCPAGWVAIEESLDAYGAGFVYVTYHINDVLTSSAPLPSVPKSVPAVGINRGKLGGISDFYDLLPPDIGREADVDLKIDLFWKDESRRELMAGATATFVENLPRGDYEMELILVADRLTDPLWGQTNYFAGQNRQGKYWDIFSKGGVVVYGLEYNSVAVMAQTGSALEGTLPQNPQKFDTYCVQGSFKLEDGISTSGLMLTEKKENLRVIGVLKERKSGKMLNAATSSHSALAGLASDKEESDGIESICDGSEQPEREILYDLQGRRIANPCAGQPYVKVTILSDGSLKSRKIAGSAIK